DYKLSWMNRLLTHAQTLLNQGGPVVLTGDFNIIPTEADVYRPERWVNDAVFRPETRAVFTALAEQGWTDAIRQVYPDQTVYTYWDYFRNAFSRDAGLRIDHFLLNPAVAPQLRSAGVDRGVRGWEKTSDHAPVWIELGPKAEI